MRCKSRNLSQIVFATIWLLSLIGGLLLTTYTLPMLVRGEGLRTSQGLDELLLRESPSVTQVDPATAPNDVDTQVSISVIGFNNTPQIFLGETELFDVTLVSETELTAIVPWGLVPGDYDLRVVNPDGVSATWDSVFTVADGFGEFITNGPYSGQAVQMALQPDNPSTVYGIMWDAGLFMSEDGGDNWAQIHNHNGGLQLDFDAVDPNILYFGSSELYRSMDNG